MNHHLQRRQLLQYFALGLAGTAASPLAATAVHSGQTPAPDSQLQHRPANRLAGLSIGETTLPEFQGISQWLNSPPLKVNDLRGKVVLVQFWTIGCINCQRTLPYLGRWHEQYTEQGLRVIGVHTPEFAFEREVKNVKQALQRYRITYAVPLDNQYQTWKAYQNRYWPHLFLADRQLKLRYSHIGEGAYTQTEQMIRQLLG